MNPSDRDGPRPHGPGSFFDFWAEWAKTSGESSIALFETMQSATDPKVFQQRWLEAAEKSLDSFMRTPAFLEALRNNLKMASDLKKAQDQVIEDTARQFGLPLGSDIYGLFSRLRGFEESILNRLDAIERKIDDLESNGRARPDQSVKPKTKARAK